MLYTSVVTLCLVCFLHCFEPVQCRSTTHLNEYSNRSSLARRCLRSCFLISRHQTCFEKCLGKNKDGDFTDLNARILRINPPHLTSTSNRRKRDTGGVISCPLKREGNNSFPTSRAQLRQYENSSKWYLNISWDSLPDSPNLTGYGLKYLCNDGEEYIGMQKNETFKILNESECCWSRNMSFLYMVLGLPCLGYHDLVNKYKTIESITDKVFCTVTAATTASVGTANLDEFSSTVSTAYNDATVSLETKQHNEVVAKASVGTANLDEFSSTVSTAYNDATVSLETKQHNKIVAKVLLIVITITVVLVFVFSATYLYLRKRKKDKRHLSVDDADYDAFVIFNHNDQKWVQETLLPILEKESHYKCCVHYRDFAPGEDFVVNMTESVRKSKKVIAVISKTFFSSHWCNFELQQAIYQHIKKGNNGVIVIKIDNVSTEMFPKAIQTKSFIDYSNRVERPFFKTRLLKALESSSNAYKKDIIPMQIDG